MVSRVARSLSTSQRQKSAFLMLLQARGIAAPETEYRFHPDRKWRFDFAWPDARLALESEGGVFVGGGHGRGAKFIKDCEKYNEATLMGWRVLRVAGHLLVSEDTAALVSRALALGPPTR